MKYFIYLAIFSAVVCHATSNVVPDNVGYSSHANKVNDELEQVVYGSRVNPDNALTSISDSAYGSQVAPDTTGLSSSTDSMESRSGVKPLRSLLAEQALNYGSRGNSLLEHSLNSAYESRGHLPQQSVNSAYGSRDNVLADQALNSAYGSRGNLPQQALNSAYGSRGNVNADQALNSAYGSRGNLPQQAVNSAYGSRGNVNADQALNSAYGSRGHLPQQAVNSAYGSRGNVNADQALNSAYGSRGNLPQQAVNSAYGSRGNGNADQALNSAYGSRGNLPQQAVNSAYGSRGNVLAEQGLNSAYGSKDNSGLSELLNEVQNRNAANSMRTLLLKHRMNSALRLRDDALQENAVNSAYGSRGNAPEQLVNSAYGSGVTQDMARMLEAVQNGSPIRNAGNNNLASSACRCTSDRVPVCATDGMTYESECSMNCEAAERTSFLRVIHVGHCSSKR